MKKITQENKQKILRITDAVFTTLALLLSLQIASATNGNYIRFVCGGMFFALFLSKVFNSFNSFKENRIIFIKELCISCAYLVCGVTAVILGNELTMFIIIAIIYYTTIIANRLLVIICSNRKIKTIILNLLYIVVIVLFITGVFTEEKFIFYLHLIIAFTVVFQSLLHIIAISFSQIQLGVLRKIIRKTYAGEILFGLMLLIISFSFVFEVLEPNIKSYYDALWYSFSLVTTIGFGDITVVSGFARVLSVILGIYGIIVVALITSVIVNFYNEVKNNSTKNEVIDNPDLAEPVTAKEEDKKE